MERTLIAWNVPNLITIPLMAFMGFLLAAVLWQVGSSVLGAPQPQPSNGY